MTVNRRFTLPLKSLPNSSGKSGVGEGRRSPCSFVLCFKRSQARPAAAGTQRSRPRRSDPPSSALILPLSPQAVRASYGKGFTLSISGLFVTTKTVGARVELSEQQLLLWPGDADKIQAADSLPKGSRAHITLGCASGVEAVQTGLDLLEFVKLEKAGSKGEEVGEIGGGKLQYFGNGMWMLVLSKKIDVRAIFSGYYGKGKLVPTQSTNKRGSAFSSCTII